MVCAPNSLNSQPNVRTLLRPESRDRCHQSTARDGPLLVLGAILAHVHYFAFVSLLLGDLGESSVESGLFMSAFGLTALASTTQAGRLSARTSAPLVLGAGFLVSGAGLVVVGMSTTYLTLVAGTIIFGLGGT